MTVLRNRDSNLWEIAYPEFRYKFLQQTIKYTVRSKSFNTDFFLKSKTHEVDI
jgi:hypothetical protein